MLMRTDPFREIEKLSEALLGSRGRMTAMPMTAYRDNDTFVVLVDLPGVDAETIDLTVEQNVLSVHAERRAPTGETTQPLIDERPYGVFDRQLVLGESLDLDRLNATYQAGVLTITIPVSEKTQARKIEINAGSEPAEISA